MGKIALAAQNISMNFSSTKALNNVSIKLYKGEAMALVGENGAGKSTLIKCIAGVHIPKQGQIILEGQTTKFTNVNAALKRGIGVVHQELKLCENMSIAENIFLGKWKKQALFVSYQKMHIQAKKYLLMLGLNFDPKTKVHRLSIANQQMVEIAKVLALGAKVIILDEPTDTLSEREAEKLFACLKKLKKQGIAILYVTHRMQEIKNICERYTILKDGFFVQTGLVKKVTINNIIEMMIGRKITEQFPSRKAKAGNTIMEVNNLSSDLFFDINLNIHRNEILGIAGLVGAKRTEFAKALVGLLSYSFGKILWMQKELPKVSPRQAINRGIYYVTENRKKDGLFLNLDVGHNVIISSLKKILTKLRTVNASKIKQYLKWAQNKLNIKFNNKSDKAKQLSGGNQQKLLIAKALLTNPELLILDEPTRGVDVGSRKEIYKIINSFVAQGKAVVIISSDLPEVIGVSDRVAVFSQGKLTGILKKQELSEKAIMHLAVL